MAINKVVYGNQILIDITDSTVNANTLLAGYKAYGANGEQVTGNVTLSYHITLTQAQYDELSETEKMAEENYFYIEDATVVTADIDDTTVSSKKVWSSQKVSNELSALNSSIAVIGERVHSEGYTAYTVQHGGVINQITIPSDGTYLFMSYIRGASCWYTKNGVIYPNSAVVTADATSYVTVWTLEEGDVIAQVNQTGSAQTYTASEMSATRIK